MSTPDTIYYWALHLLAIVFWTIRAVMFFDKLLKLSKRASFTVAGVVVAAMFGLVGFFWNNPPSNDVLTHIYVAFLWVTPLVAAWYARKIKIRDLRIASLIILLVLSAISVYHIGYAGVAIVSDGLLNNNNDPVTCKMSEYEQ